MYMYVVRSDDVLKVDILSLGYVLMQLIYCKGNSGKLPNTLPVRVNYMSIIIIIIIFILISSANLN